LFGFSLPIKKKPLPYPDHHAKLAQEKTGVHGQKKHENSAVHKRAYRKMENRSAKHERTLCSNGILRKTAAKSTAIGF